MATTPPNGLSKLGEYTISKNLGEGTFGKVKLAVHTLSGQKVALKFIHKGSINAMKVRTRVTREIAFLKMLKHPHIIKLYEVIDTPTHVIMVMEYAGGELFNYIVDNGRLSEAAARKFFQQIIYGLAYSHSHNIVHRDIKPENVLLDDSQNVKLADFGLSNEISDGSWLSTSCGSPNYAAPEVISGKLYAGPEIDVWSLGVILYVMVCGRLPFEDEHVPTLFQKISAGAYHTPSFLSQDLRFLIAGMLAVDPIKRVTVPEILAHPWTNIELPRYLRRMLRSLTAGPALDSLSSLLGPNVSDDPDFLPGIGRLDRAVFDELVCSLGVDPSLVKGALEAVNENAVKVAYKLFQDRRIARNLDVIGEQEESENIPSKAVWIPSVGLSTVYRDIGPSSDDDYDSGAGGEYSDDDSGSSDDEIDWTSEHSFNWLDSSFVGLPSSEASPVFLPANHHLASYGNSRSAASSRGRLSPGGSGTRSPRHRHHRDQLPKQPRWHFGIRSSSPPMEVMLELYRTLETLGIQWREKGGIWALHPDQHHTASARPGQASTNEPGSSSDSYEKVAKDILDIYYVECRWRVRDAVLLFDLQLYQVDAMNYLVDFRDLGYYQASTLPNAGCFDSAETQGLPHTKKGGDYYNPLLFLECACHLIIELAGGSG